MADGLRQVALAGAARTEKQSIFPLADKGARGQIEDQATIHLRVEGEVEVVQGLLRVAEGRLFAAPLQQPIAAPVQLVGDQARDQIDRRHGFGLSLMQAGFQHGGYAAEPQLS
ncbi:MAG TPA: hypothetical protein VF018_14060 [Acidobacteriaceae bacterium]